MGVTNQVYVVFASHRATYTLDLDTCCFFVCLYLQLIRLNVLLFIIFVTNINNIFSFCFKNIAIPCVSSFQDTQCGFKLFSRSAARALFSSLHIHRWAFDVELLVLASK